MQSILHGRVIYGRLNYLDKEYQTGGYNNYCVDSSFVWFEPNSNKVLERAGLYEVVFLPNRKIARQQSDKLGSKLTNDLNIFNTQTLLHKSQ